MSDARSKPSDEVTWHVLSTKTEWMEVFRMTDEQRTVMDVVRLVGDRVELAHGALDGPAWIGGGGSTFGQTEDGVRLWDSDGRATTNHDLDELPDWAEQHRDQIARYVKATVAGRSSD